MLRTKDCLGVTIFTQWLKVICKKCIMLLLNAKLFSTTVRNKHLINCVLVYINWPCFQSNHLSLAVGVGWGLFKVVATFSHVGGSFNIFMATTRGVWIIPVRTAFLSTTVCVTNFPCVLGIRRTWYYSWYYCFTAPSLKCTSAGLHMVVHVGLSFARHFLCFACHKCEDLWRHIVCK